MTTEQSAADKMSEKPATAAATATTAAATGSAAVATAAAPAAAPSPPQQKLSESDDFTEDSADNTADAAREDTSQQSGLATVESEYDTASDSPSDGEEEYDEQDEESGESGESGDEEEEEEELGSETDGGGSDDDVIEVLDYERQSGDGQEQEADAKKKVDDDEDRSNPQYIPKKGTFYEHDDRTLEDEENGKDVDDENAKNDDQSVGGGGGGSGDGRKGVEKSMASKTMKKWQASADRWTHDRFDESEQAPKSRAELVSAYGYDIRSEDGPPRARRRRRYARGPNKYTRNWEDEDAYSKSNNVNEHTRPRKSLPRPEEFPELGGNGGATNNNSSLNSSGSGGGKSRSSQNMRRASRQSRSSIDERLDERSGGRPRPAERRRVDHDRGMERDRGDRYDQPRGPPERNWDRERDYDQQQQQQHDGSYRDGRNDGSRYSADRMANNNNSYHNKENKLLNSRSSKEKDRRGSDYKVITSLQFKNQTRNKANEGGLPIAGPGGVAGGQVVHSNSGGALSGSSQSNKMNNAMVQNAAGGGVPERMPVQPHYPNQQQAQLIQQQPPPQIPQQQAPIQQAQPQPQQIPQQQQLHQQSSYDDHYDSYGDSKMPKDAKFPYNPPANATIQSVEIGQTDIPKYPPPQPQAQRPSKDRQPQIPASLPATSNVAALNARSQISPRQIVTTPQQQQQQQYQLQQAQYQQQQLHGPPAGQTPTQVPPPQLPQQQTQPPPTAAQLHLLAAAQDSGSRSSKRYSNLRQRSTLDQPPNVVVAPSPLHEQQQQQLLHQQQQQQLLLQQELHNQQQKLVTSQAPKPGGYPQQPTLPLSLPNEYLSQPAAASKPQPASQAPPVQYQHPAAAAAGYYNPNTPAANDFGTTNAPVPQPPTVVNQQAPNPLLSAPQYPQYSQPSTQYIQAPPPAAYIPQTTAAPQPTPQPATAAPPPQILNYVPTINPTPPAQYPAAPYTYTQNAYNPVAVPQPVVAPAPVVPINPSPSAATAALYQSSGGITYYAPQSQTQAPRPLPSQRRPTAAIPILAPPDRKTKNNRSDATGGAAGGSSNDAEDSQQSGGNSNAAADNIDHILDNMFVQRAPYQPPSATTTATATRKSPSPAPGSGGADKDGGKDADKEAVDKMGESVKNLTIQEENRPVLDALAAAGGAEKLDLAVTAPSVDPTAG